MNLKQIKLDLTVRLMNISQQSNMLQAVKEAMTNFKGEIGGFIDTAVLGDLGIDHNIVTKKYAVYYEKCTLNLDLVVNKETSHQYINGFTLL